MARAPITSPCAWHGEQLCRRAGWQHRLEDDHLAELDAAQLLPAGFEVLWRNTEPGRPRGGIAPAQLCETQGAREYF